MPFDLSSLVARFEHVPTEIHREAEAHAALSQELAAFAIKVVPTLPYGQEVEEFVSVLAAAGEFAHKAIDAGAQRAEAAAGVVRLNDKVVSAPEQAPVATSAVDEAAQAGAAPVAATPPAAPEAPAVPVASAPAEHVAEPPAPAQ